MKIIKPFFPSSVQILTIENVLEMSKKEIKQSIINKLENNNPNALKNQSYTTYLTASNNLLILSFPENTKDIPNIISPIFNICRHFIQNNSYGEREFHIFGFLKTGTIVVFNNDEMIKYIFNSSNIQMDINSIIKQLKTTGTINFKIYTDVELDTLESKIINLEDIKILSKLDKSEILNSNNKYNFIIKRFFNKIFMIFELKNIFLISLIGLSVYSLKENMDIKKEIVIGNQKINTLMSQINNGNKTENINNNEEIKKIIRTNENITNNLNSLKLNNENILNQLKKMSEMKENSKEINVKEEIIKNNEKLSEKNSDLIIKEDKIFDKKKDIKSDSEKDKIELLQIIKSFNVEIKTITKDYITLSIKNNYYRLENGQKIEVEGIYITKENNNIYFNKNNQKIIYKIVDNNLFEI